MSKKRAIVYIDGYNLHYGMAAAHLQNFAWLNLQSLAEQLIKANMQLSAVKYFTAMACSAPLQKWQNYYRRALTAYCPKLAIIDGDFLTKTNKCQNCGSKTRIFEEKKTDVNIASHLLVDAFTNEFDCCYVVSGDSDLVPPLTMLQTHLPQKISFIACPPKRKSEELCDQADYHFFINKTLWRRCQLPPTIALPSGRVINQLPLP